MKIKIGELSKLTGCKVVTIRHYEAEGLLLSPKRTNSNYRIYGDNDIDRLCFIRNCRLLGISISEIRELLSIDKNSKSTHAFLRVLLKKHIKDIDDRISALTDLKLHLEYLYGQTRGNARSSRSVMDVLGDKDKCPYCNKDLRKRAQKNLS